MSDIVDKLLWLGAAAPPPEAGVDIPRATAWRWAVVTQINPLRIRLDGDSAALSATPDSLVGGLAVNDRVWVQLVGQYIVVVGTTMKNAGWVNITVNPGFSAQGSEIPQVRVEGNKIYARGGWSNLGLTASATFTVGNVPAGNRPPDRNALWRWATNGGGTSGNGLLEFATGNIQIRTSATVSSYFFFPTGTFWFRS